MEYKKNWQEVKERHSLFWGKGLRDQILVRIYVRNRPFEEWLTTSKRVVQVESKRFPDRDFVFKTWDLKLRILKELEDDSLPVMIPTEFDQGLFGGIFGAETAFNYDAESGWISSMAKTFLPEYSAIDILEVREEGIWMSSPLN